MHTRRLANTYPPPSPSSGFTGGKFISRLPLRVILARPRSISDRRGRAQFPHFRASGFECRRVALRRSLAKRTNARNETRHDTPCNAFLLCFCSRISVITQLLTTRKYRRRLLFPPNFAFVARTVDNNETIAICSLFTFSTSCCRRKM